MQSRDQNSLRWYLIRAKPGKETLVRTQLQGAVDEVFVPQMKKNKTSRHSGSRATEPLFPSYLFARLDLQGNYFRVRYAREVRDPVSFGGEPVVVPDELVEQFKSLAEETPHPPASGPKSQRPVPRHGGGSTDSLAALFRSRLSADERINLLFRSLR